MKWLSILSLLGKERFRFCYILVCEVFVQFIQWQSHCSRHADLVSYSSYISVSIRNLIIFSTSQFFPSSVPMSPWILYFFLMSLHWGSLASNVLLLVFGFRMLHFCKLVVVHSLTSDVRMSNPYPAQFDLVLPSAIV